jgi:hypothetical protein
LKITQKNAYIKRHSEENFTFSAADLNGRKEG